MNQVTCTYCGKVKEKRVYRKCVHYFCDATCKQRYYATQNKEERREYMKRYQEEYRNRPGRGIGRIDMTKGKFTLIGGPADVSDLVQHECKLSVTEVELGIKNGTFPPGCTLQRYDDVYVTTEKGLEALQASR